MCGIVGYVGGREAAPILLEGLSRLEYRGYDSAGLAIQNGAGVVTRKLAGRVAGLRQLVTAEPIHGSSGIAHTRWATHGAPTTKNAHPHTDCAGTIAVAHNGIIENHASLRQMLVAKGHRFASETDTETLAHLIEQFYDGSLEQAVAEALQEVEGTYGIVVVSTKEPHTIVAARSGSPLLLGLGNGENFVASDPSAVLAYTRSVVYLDEGNLAVVTPSGYQVKDRHAVPLSKQVSQIEWDLATIERGGYPHFMLKEICEQPESIRNTLRGRLLEEEGTARLGGINLKPEALAGINRIVLTACGTSWHAALVGEYMLEELARLPTEVEYASEFRYRNPLVDEHTLVIVISQSGETADTLAALREAKRRGARTLGIVNVVGSSIAREVDGGIFIHAGPEIGVASTKAFTSQIAALALFTLHLGRLRSLSILQGREIVKALRKLPEQVEAVLGKRALLEELAERYTRASNVLYLGRGYNFPVALEGALKLKEISYIHAEGYPAAEMKHGPIALIDDNMPVVFICTQDSAYDKVVSNMEEVRARRGKIIAVATEGDDQVRRRADHVIYVPRTEEMLTPILSVVPLQLMAYHMAVARGCDVDQPRNLAKSVTVE